MSNGIDNRDEMDIIELDREHMEGVMGGWELEQLNGADRRRWERYQEQLKSDDRDLRREAKNHLKKLAEKYAKSMTAHEKGWITGLSFFCTPIAPRSAVPTRRGRFQRVITLGVGFGGRALGIQGDPNVRLLTNASLTKPRNVIIVKR